MAFGTITSTSNTFGSVDGTATGVVPGTLSGSIGVPGPAGPTGPQGPAGQGVPAGGTAGQFLTKIDGTNYNTNWTTLDISGKRDLTDYDFTNVADEKLETFGLTLEPPVGSTAIYDSELSVDNLVFKKDTSIGGTEVGQQIEMYYSTFVGFNGQVGLGTRIKSWEDVDGTITDTDGFGFTVDGVNGLNFTKWNGDPFASTMQYGRTSITFPNASVQTTAFPGFNNAALTGNPTAPTPATSDNDTSIATTAFVKAQGYATLASPIFTGNPTAPTAALGDNDTSIATTAFVQQELASGTAVAKNLEVRVRNQSGSTMAAGTIVYISGATGNLPLITKAQANNDANSAQTIGFVKTSIANNGTGFVIVRGELESIDTSALSEGVQLYLSPTTAGTWTTTKPSAPQHLVYVGVVIRSHPTLGTILVSVQNGYELHELHDVAIASEANNDLLVYELSTDLWKNKSFSTLGLATQSYVTSQGYITSSALTPYAPLAGATFTGLVSTPASATGGAGLRVIPGVAPTSPTNGDVWNNGTDLQVRLNGVTETVAEQSWVTAQGFAPLASPTFSGTPSLPTGTTAVTQSAGNSTTALATTAFVTTADNLKANIASPSLTGTPLAPTASVNTNSTQIATTGFVLDMLSDATWSAPPVSTTTTVTSGTGANYVNVPPDYGYLVGPNVNLAGFCQKHIELFARSNSSYGFNLSKEIRVACKIAANWNATFTATTQTLFFRLKTGTTNGTLSQRGFGISINLATKVLSILAHDGTTLTTKATSWAVPFAGIASVDFMVKSDGTGTVYAYADGVLIDSTTGMSTLAASVTTQALAVVEVNSAGGTSTANATTYISNLRAFVAHG